MEASSFSLLITPRHRPCLSSLLPRRRKPLHLRTSRNNEDHHQSIVDKNTVTLRKRITEIKALDRAEECVELEKDYYYKFYHSDVCEILGLLQFHMMSREPSMGIGLTLTLRLIIPTSVLVMLLHLMDAAKENRPAPPQSQRKSSRSSIHHLASTRRRRTIVFASQRRGFGSEYGGWLVDENMVVLRKRLHEMRMMTERNKEPRRLDWSEWEKKYEERYKRCVYEVVGLVQNVLMNSRPSLAAGMLFMFLFSVPISLALIMIHLFS
ncbi:hypothetical protein J5N97_007499 [Dioscorea zingiberensis]|uniref:Uncharacterized protein n=1 Tax=Dioscorea zingiberensis TaxID=325984 RepID=A0A9D5DBW5_9LILI|nr:hypothetical protein J5N97_007499 [Dioscorea zingiberensis]